MSYLERARHRASPTEIELRAPDLGDFRLGNGGPEYVWAFDSGVPGPTVLVNALSHGNEICGALALERLLRLGVRPQRGQLILVFANVAAFCGFDSERPYASRSVDEDFNRLWSEAVLEGGGNSVELRRARTLRPIYDQADALLDLHSMTQPGAALTLCGRTSRGRALALALGFPHWVIADSGHAAGRRLMDYGGFVAPDRADVAWPIGAEARDKVALLVECGQHWEAGSAAAAFAVCLRFLCHFGVMAPAMAARLMPPGIAPARPQVIDVTEAITATSDHFVFVPNCLGLTDGPIPGTTMVPVAGTVFGWDAGRPVRTPHENCILIMPTRAARRGQTVVRLGRLLSA